MSDISKLRAEYQRLAKAVQNAKRDSPEWKQLMHQKGEAHIRLQKALYDQKHGKVAEEPKVVQPEPAPEPEPEPDPTPEPEETSEPPRRSYRRRAS